MRNPLVETCLAITRAGYSKDLKIPTAYDNPKIAPLAKFLLNEIGVRLLPPVKWGDKRHRVALCFGSGIDSYCAFHYALRSGVQASVVYVDYGHSYAARELMVFHELESAWKRLWDGCVPITAFDKDLVAWKALWEKKGLEASLGQVEFIQYSVDVMPRGPLDLLWEDYIIPARNLFLAAIGSQHAPAVWIIANKRADETVGTPDKTSRFYRATSDLFSDFYGYPVRVRSPFLHLSKLEMVSGFLSGSVSLDGFRQTYSCYSGDEVPCGICYACYKRYKLFQALEEQYHFATHPADGPNFLKYQAKEEAKGR